MKYPCFAIAALAALSIGTKAESADLINLILQSPVTYGLNVSRDQPANERGGMTWGIVVDTTGGADFSMLDTSMSAGWFSGGINTSGQWIGGDLLYLTAPTATTFTLGPMAGSITTVNGIEASGSNHSLEKGQAYSFVIIWFEASIAIDQAPAANNRYGFLPVEGVVIPALDDSNGREVRIPGLGDVSSLVKTGFFVAVPEPSTYALLIGAMAIGGTTVARRRAKLKAA